jgi:parallel beta-helix repeat protein
MEGPGNIDNHFYNNKVKNARGIGILLVHCERFLIGKNIISHNTNGILTATSVVNIEENDIS